ncbi:hypothetical protein LBMAG46_31860 [Planctomycetia bacterium]|nr:hypothetical protein LBMAG46_31860 [Planctomycetia bacterium]
MKANAGGNLQPQHVYGRDHFIEFLWQTLQSQSILQSGERRTGKTQILRKMLQQPKPGWKPVFHDLEKIHSALEFAELVYDDIQQFLGTATRAKNFIQRWFEHNETDYINLKGRTWKQLLNSAVADLDKSSQTEKLVFFWDEVPWMLDSICRHEGLPVAAQVLDAIRSLRIEHTSFRVILTGSIGIHHILAKLSAAGIPTPAINDLYQAHVPPLNPADAVHLATDLLTGENIHCSHLHDVAHSIAEEVDCQPFYIQHIVAALRLKQDPVTPDTIRQHVRQQLVDANDPWQLAHYRNRLHSYYPNGSDARHAAAILDTLAATPDQQPALAVPQLKQHLAAGTSAPPDHDHLLQLLRLLDADHYITRDTLGHYHFRSQLIRRWWKLDRAL